jgi:hypothetical protein
MRFPVNAKIAPVTAGAIGVVAGSPMPDGGISQSAPWLEQVRQTFLRFGPERCRLDDSVDAVVHELMNNSRYKSSYEIGGTMIAHVLSRSEASFAETALFEQLGVRCEVLIGVVVEATATGS